MQAKVTQTNIFIYINMFVPRKFLWRKEEIKNFYDFILPFVEGLKTDLTTKPNGAESEIETWKNNFENLPFGNVGEVYKNRVQTYNKEKNRFEPNIEGKRLLNLSYTFIDHEHNIKNRVHEDDETEISKRYPTAYQLLDVLGDKCQRISYIAFAPQTAQFKTVIPEYRFTDNTVARVYVPIMVPEGKATLCHMPAIGVGVTMETLPFNQIFVQDVQRFYEIRNDSDQWLVYLILDVERQELGLEPGEVYERDYGRSMWVI